MVLKWPFRQEMRLAFFRRAGNTKAEEQILRFCFVVRQARVDVNFRLDNVQFFQLLLRHDPIDPASLGVVFFEHLVQLTYMAFGTRHCAGLLEESFGQVIGAFGKADLVVIVTLQVVDALTALE